MIDIFSSFPTISSRAAISAHGAQAPELGVLQAEIPPIGSRAAESSEKRIFCHDLAYFSEIVGKDDFLPTNAGFIDLMPCLMAVPPAARAASCLTRKKLPFEVTYLRAG